MPLCTINHFDVRDRYCKRKFEENAEDKFVVENAAAKQQPSDQEIKIHDPTMASFVCPISKATMSDPVIDPEGNSFERAEITRWLAAHGTSPIT